ncbi:MAG: B12-binding domain-containing radical SAM protein [Magnetococcales bacterium]|nr:B12-binding domain-containing radical SAM protein [Magnetococcales bacterium]
MARTALPIVFSLSERATRPRVVVLVRPPSFVSRLAVAAPLTPPLGVAYVAAYLRAVGHRVSVVDAVGEGLHQPELLDQRRVRRGLSFAQIVARIDPACEVVGVSCMFSSEWPFVKELIGLIHRERPELRIIVGGEHITAMPEHSLESCPEIFGAVLGEGEETTAALLEHLDDPEGLARCAGVVYRDRTTGALRRNPRMGRIRNIDELPWPAWDLLPIENYLNQGLGLGTRRGRSFPMLATRGCPFQCAFCSNKEMWMTRWTARDPEKLLDEIADAVERYRIDDVQFFDLTAIVRKSWLLEFARGLERRRFGITWQLPVGTRAEAIDREVARALMASGCCTITFAPESGSPQTLRRIDKKVDLAQMRRAMSDCLAEGLNVKANIMLGFPGETHGDVWKTLRFIFALSVPIGIHDLSVYPFSPYPGSALFARMEAEGRIDGILSDRWYLSLSYAEFSALQSYSEHFGLRSLRLYQLLGYLIFYPLNFLARPVRIYRLVRNLITGRHQSKGETIIALFLRRLLGKAYG